MPHPYWPLFDLRARTPRLERDEWERRRRGDIVLEGLEPCLSLLGAAGPA